MSIWVIGILIGCGLVCNIMSAIFGIGGGVLLVPLLKTLFPHYPIQMIAATSLTIVMGTALINLCFLRIQQSGVSLKNTLLWSVAMIIGVQIGFEGSFLMPERYIVLVFILTLLILALKTFFSRQDLPPPKHTVDDRCKGFGFCLFGGTVAGITGIGGGSIMAPLIGQLRSVSIAQVAVYTNAMMVIGGIGNLYAYLSRTPPLNAHAWQIGYVDFAIVALVVASSFIMSFFSMKLRKLISPTLTRRLLALILVAIALYMWLISP